MNTVKTKGWKIALYQAHVGLVDSEGNTVASIGPRGNKIAWKNANLIVKAVNLYLKAE